MAERKKKSKEIEESKEKKVSRPRKKKVKAEEIKAVEAPLAVPQAPAPPVEVKVYVPREKRWPILPAGTKYYGTGRRKEAIAKVWLASGSGKVTVNGKDLSDYFCRRELLGFQINRPFAAAQLTGKYDVYAKVFGGGVPAQAGAVSLGIARALVQLNPELKVLLKREGLLTRDSRMKERKKYGLKRARRAFQYTKR